MTTSPSVDRVSATTRLFFDKLGELDAAFKQQERRGDATCAGSIPNCLMFSLKDDRPVIAFFFDMHPAKCARISQIALEVFGGFSIHECFLTDTRGAPVFEGEPLFPIVYRDYAEHVARTLRTRKHIEA